MNLIINLQNGTQYKIKGYNLKECGIYKNTFFIEYFKGERIEFPVNTLSSFNLESPKFAKLAPQKGDSVVMNTATTILSKFLP